MRGTFRPFILGMTDETQTVSDGVSAAETDSLSSWLNRPNETDEGEN